MCYMVKYELGSINTAFCYCDNLKCAYPRYGLSAEVLELIYRIEKKKGTLIDVIWKTPNQAYLIQSSEIEEIRENYIELKTKNTIKNLLQI